VEPGFSRKKWINPHFSPDGVNFYTNLELTEKMSAKAIREYHGKKLASRWLSHYSNLVKYDTSDDEYISVASNFGLDSEDKIYGFYAVIKNILDIKISQNPPPFVIKYAVEFFQKWININNMDELNKFASLIDKYKLKTVPDMPIAKVVFALNSINVKWFDYDDFFGVWQQNSTQTNDVMSIIVNNLTDETVFNYKLIYAFFGNNSLILEIVL
jgi:hypothetical protein